MLLELLHDTAGWIVLVSGFGFLCWRVALADNGGR